MSAELRDQSASAVEPAPGTARLLTTSGETEVDADRACVERYLAADDFFWLDVSRPSADELDWLGQKLHLHPLVLEDLRSFGQRPKLDPYDGYSVLVVYGSAPDDDGLVEVHCIVTEEYLVTVRRDDCPAFDDAWERYASEERRGHASSALLLHRVVDGLIDSFFPALTSLDERIDELQEEILSRPHTAQLRELMDYKRRLIHLRKIVTPERDLFAQIVASPDPLPGWSDESLRYFRDAYDHLIRLSEIVEAYRDLLTSTLDVYLSSRADRRDDVMKQLTVIATIFLPITFITGFFGQNFGYLVTHLLGSEEALIIGTLIQVATVVGILLVFHRRRWI